MKNNDGIFRGQVPDSPRTALPVRHTATERSARSLTLDLEYVETSPTVSRTECTSHPAVAPLGIAVGGLDLRDAPEDGRYYNGSHLRRRATGCCPSEAVIHWPAGALGEPAQP